MRWLLASRSGGRMGGGYLSGTDGTWGGLYGEIIYCNGLALGVFYCVFSVVSIMYVVGMEVLAINGGVPD